MTGRRIPTHSSTHPDAATVPVVVNGQELIGRDGEPLSATLLANGVTAVGSGTYTGRPRGVVGIGLEEPSAYVRLDSPPGDSMTQATRVETRAGVRAAGLAGYARLPEDREAAPGDSMWAHCDVLVVGGGPAGVAAAMAAARAGSRVVLAEDGPHLGGDLLGSQRNVDGLTARQWIEAARTDLESEPEVRILTRTTVTGHYYHGDVTALQRRDHTHRLWHIRAERVVLATGALERPVAFEGNDRPGTMLAGAAARYARRHGVVAGESAVVFSCHDEALWSAVELHDAGVALGTVADARPTPGAAPVEALHERGIAVRTSSGVTRTIADADGRVNGAAVAPIDSEGETTGAAEELACDLVAVSGGYDAAIALATHIGGQTRWDPAAAGVLPDTLPAGVHCVGAARGTREAQAAVDEGRKVGNAAAWGSGEEDLGPPVSSGDAPPAALWTVRGSETDPDRVFVDMQRDATLADIRSALAAGMFSIEHIKRYTTIGTGPDQGRTSGVLTSGIVAQETGRTVQDVGGTTARPPYVPVPFTAMAGLDRGELLIPARHTPMHEWHVSHGAVFEDVGQWRRARYYPRGTEDMRSAVLRECAATRESVGVLDASTLGKIMVEGRDAGAFLDQIYTGNFSTLRTGKCRYGVMCTADGIVLDDGVAVRLGESSFMATTTTGNAETVLSWMEEWLQTEWPHMCVHVTHVTDHWATISVVGPRSRDVVAQLAPDLDVSVEEFEFMAVREASVLGVPARILRVSFTGELTFEINVPAWYGQAVWDAVMAAGSPYGITPYGTETMHVLRAEKGFIVVGHETDGNVTPVDAGLGWAVSKRKDFIGKRSLWRPDIARDDREQLVGLLPEDTEHVLAEGAQLVDTPPVTPVPRERPHPPQGRVTSSYASAAMERSFALGLLRGGRNRHGERVYAVHLDQTEPVLVTDPVFYDKEGSRRDG